MVRLLCIRKSAVVDSLAKKWSRGWGNASSASAKRLGPDTFVALSENLKSFPPTYLTSCEFDPLRDDSKVIESALKEVGVPTKHDYYAGMPHYFWIFPSVPESQQYICNLLAGIGWLQSQM